MNVCQKIATYFCLFFLGLYTTCEALVMIGTGEKDITPRAGTPSAGYIARNGAGMSGTHDPLLATALFIDNGESRVVFCSVDNMGLTYKTVQKAICHAQKHPLLASSNIYIGSTHTHSGGGAYLDIPGVGSALAGAYDPTVEEFYVDGVAAAMIEAAETAQPAQIGIGYGHAEGLNAYRKGCPLAGTPLTDVAVIKAVRPDGSPLALLFNFSMHPTVLSASNTLFSADFVGCAREEIKKTLGLGTSVLYFNGAQAEIVPALVEGKEEFEECSRIGASLARAVLEIWHDIFLAPTVDIVTAKETYAFSPEPTPFGPALPISRYETEINALVFDCTHVFVTIPGELSCSYDSLLKGKAAALGYQHLSILGLVNDAHGYILTPEAWRQKVREAHLSFGGESYGEFVSEKTATLLQSTLQKTLKKNPTQRF